MNKTILKALGFNKELEQVEKGLCPFCGEIPGDFRNDLSKHEFHISGLCQSCQDQIFGTD